MEGQNIYVDSIRFKSAWFLEMWIGMWIFDHELIYHIVFTLWIKLIMLHLIKRFILKVQLIKGLLDIKFWLGLLIKRWSKFWVKINKPISSKIWRKFGKHPCIGLGRISPYIFKGGVVIFLLGE